MKNERDDYLDRIIAGITHEVRNPLQGIIASLSMINLKANDDPSMKPFVDMIQKEVSRISRMMEDLLELREASVLHKQPLPLMRCIQDAVRNVEEDREKRGASLYVSAPAVDAVFSVDAARMARALEAVIRNALESRETQASVIVSCILAVPEELRITVQDNGSGIPSENLPHVMEPFSTTKGKRAGLGLCLAERVIRAHAGRIQIQSEQGKGTTVTILLPVTA